MKRIGNLYHQIAEVENLLLAFYKAQQGKKDSPEIISYRRNLQCNILQLQSQLLDGAVDIGHYQFFMVRDPKPRQICAASFPERVLHHAIMNICEPVLERYAIFDSYACRREKGSRKALVRAQQFAGKYIWYLKLDIRKYFDSIDQEILHQMLARRYKEPSLLALFDKLLKTYATKPGRGMPIGNLVSQHLANFYLGRMDHWLKDDLGIKGYLRYMDDFLIFHDCKSRLKKLLAELVHFLAEELGLQLKKNTQLNRCTYGIPFLGYRVFPGHFRLMVMSKKRLAEKFKNYERLFCDGFWDEKTLARHVEPLFEFARFADTFGLRSGILAEHGVVS